MGKIEKIVNNPRTLLSYAFSNGPTRWIPDELYLRIEWRIKMGSTLDFDQGRPLTFNEKLQWLKLHDHNPLYTMLVDKLKVKQWVAERIGWEFVVPTYATWNRAEDIDISELPSQFVLKTNHDNGGVIICYDKSMFDIAAAKKKLMKHMNSNYFYKHREWPYKDVKPVVFAEKYLGSNEQEKAKGLDDYKLFHFSNGRIVTLVCEDRLAGTGLKKTFFDEEWCPMDIAEGGHEANPAHPVPEYFEQMKKIANCLAADMPFCRVDFFESNGRCYFGEMTFYPNSGFERFNPGDWDLEFGSWIKLPVL